MTKYLVVVDPGMSSGIVQLTYGGEVPVLDQAWQTTGGLRGFLDLWNRSMDLTYDELVVEKFNARNTGGFSYTTASLEPLRIEGAIEALEPPGSVQYVQPPQQYFAGGKGKAEKKRLQHKALKDMGYYVTGSMVDSPDADDVRSALAHGLAYLSRTGHRPTYNMLSDWNERNSG